MAHPEQLGKYTIKTLLGEGAMGVVYKAFDPGIGRLVAIKTIRRALSQDRHAETSLADRFRNEARAVGRLTHPGIVAIYELGQDGDNAFIAMEYVEGRDLSQILTATPILPEPDVQQVMCQLLAALECAHQQGVWHRDIKPANLIISTAGQLKVTDFGIARIESAALTQVSSTIGTPGYMAPEQYTGDRIDHRVDIFASGVLLYRMLSGQAPFTGSPEAVMYGIMAREPAPLAQFAAADIASFYAPIIARAMAKDPAQRFPTAAAFREALQRRTFAIEDATAETRLMTS
ncbi:MAG: serine/threonine-protein kinase, partial [Rhodoferax sp.]